MIIYGNNSYNIDSNRNLLVNLAYFNRYYSKSEEIVGSDNNIKIYN